jgi:hypothetical protein
MLHDMVGEPVIEPAKLHAVSLQRKKPDPNAAEKCMAGIAFVQKDFRAHMNRSNYIADRLLAMMI